MNNDKIKGQIRHFIGAVGAVLVNLGVTDEATVSTTAEAGAASVDAAGGFMDMAANFVTEVAGAAALLWASVWSWKAKKDG